MTASDLSNKDETEIQLKKRIAELEKANQDLRAEILECKQVGETLFCNQSLLESVMQTTDFMLAFFDPQFNFVWVNPAYAESCHMKPEEMMGENHFALYPHEENEVIFRKVRDTCEGVFYKDKPFVYPDQPERSVTYWDWSLAPVKDSDGNVTGLVLSLRETTKYKQAEKALKIKEKNFRSIFEYFKMGIIVGDQEGRVIQSNPAVEHMLGYEKEELRNKSFKEFTYSEDLNIEMPLIFELKAGKRDYYEVEKRYIRKDGQIIWIRLIGTIFLGSHSEISSLALIEDITERKKVEEALRISEERFRLALKNSPVNISSQDLNLRYTWQYNPQLGYEVKDVVGKTDPELLTPETAEHVTLLKLKAIENNQQVREEVATQCQGNTFTYDFTVEPLHNLLGQVIGVTNIVIDITERKKAEEALKKSEEKYRLLYEKMLDGFIIVGMDGFFREYNNAYREMLGYSDAELQHLTYSDITPEKWHAFEARIVEEEIVKKGYSGIYEKEYRRKDGTIIPIELRTYLIRDTFGQPAGMWGMVRDITGRKKAEKALLIANETLEAKVKERTEELEKAYNSLKESETSLAEAQEMAHIGNWTRDFATGEVHWSDEVYRIFGFKPQEFGINYESFLSRVHPEDRDYVINKVKKSLSELFFDVEYRIVRVDSEELVVHENIKVVCDKENNPIQLKGTVQDITIRKKSEEKIRVLADIVESSNDAIVTRSLDNIIISWNKGAKQIFGYSEEEILGKDISILEPANLKGEAKRLTEKIRNNEEIKLYETIRITKDGTPVNVSATLSPILNAVGKLVAVSTIYRDVTEHKKAEEKIKVLANAVESSNDAIVTLSVEGIVMSWNKGAEQIYGYSPKDILGKQISILEPNNLKGEIKYFSEKIKQGEKIQTYESLRLRKDGKLINVSVTLSPIFNARELIAVSAIARDITEHKKAQEALAKIEIAQKQEIHHRIKNNLQVVSSLLDLQAEKFRGKKNIEESQIQEAFKESQDRVISMALIHEELHKGGQIDTLNISNYIGELADNLLLTYSVCNNGIILEADIEKDIFFNMDTAIPLGIIVNELISNSFKHAFTGRDKGEIKINLHREEDGECEIESDKNTTFILSVSDNGIGIPEDFHIKDIDSLGLQLVVSLVDQIDGEIELKNNSGTEFTIKFIVTEKEKQASLTTIN